MPLTFSESNLPAEQARPLRLFLLTPGIGLMYMLLNMPQMLEREMIITRLLCIINPLMIFTPLAQIA